MKPNILFRVISSAIFLSAAMLATGCKTTVDDQTLANNVHTALTADATIAQQPIQDTVQNGVVTLTGNVSDDTAVSVAARDAAVVKGVKQVVNAMTVAGIAVTPTVTLPSAPSNPRPVTHQERVAISNHQPLPPPAANIPPPPPQPVLHTVAVPAGIDIPIRITETLDSETTQPGTPFNGVITRDVVEGGYVVLPAGSAVSGRVVAAQDAGHFKGHSLLSIELTAVRRHGNLISVSTEPYVVEGKNRGTNSVEKIGGGAAIGAVLGGIFGGGKGAAIGAAAGGGGGAVVQGVTRGQQVQISSESLIRFRLTNGFTVQTYELPSDEPEQGLQTR